MNFVNRSAARVTVAPKDLQVMYPNTAHIARSARSRAACRSRSRDRRLDRDRHSVASVDSTFNNAGLIRVGNINEDVTITGSSGSATQQPTDTADLKIYAQQ